MTDDKKPHWSHTQIDMITKCPESYRRRYIEGEKRPPGIAMLRGRAVHVSGEINFRQKIESHSDLPADDIIELATSQFDTELAGGYELMDDEKSLGEKNFLGQTKDEIAQMARCMAIDVAPDYQPTLVEARFRLALPGPRDIIGVLDLATDKAEVIDFKTAKKKKNQDDADTSTQLTIYGPAHFALTGKPVTGLHLDSIIHTKKGSNRQRLSTSRSSPDFVALANRINVLNKIVESGNYAPAAVGSWWCSEKWCGFHATCPYVNSERKAANGK